MNVFKISEIDLIKGIVTPHQRDLDDLTKNNIDNLRKIDENLINKINEKFGTKKNELDLGEEWAISKELFPGVILIVLYQYYGDEFGAGVAEDEIQVLYSGDNVLAVSGEDLMHLTEIVLNFMSRIVSGENNEDWYQGELSNMMKIALKERNLPFYKVKKEDYLEISKFIGAKILDLNGYDFSYEITPIPEFIIQIKGKNNQIEFEVSGDSLKLLPVYDTERLVLMSINQCLRKIKYILELDAPEICNLMFSGYYKKNYSELFP